MSDDGRFGLTIIALLGSVFSPYYAWKRRRGATDPLDHSALNVALYGRGVKRWAMIERRAGAVSRDATRLAIGPSAVRWTGGALEIDIDEITAPLPSRLRGRVCLQPRGLNPLAFPLDADGRHRWRPIAPVARASVEFNSPNLSWSGDAYFDFNAGATPLETAFVRWDWSRCSGPGGTTIFYDAARRDGSQASLALDFDAQGHGVHISPPDRAQLPSTSIWRIARGTRCDGEGAPEIVATLEDTPFYARSVLATHIGGERMTGVHESLDLDRFASPWVHALLPFRMPRWG